MSVILTRADLDANEWAACGQTAVAALIKVPLASVRAAFPPHPWCNLRDMQTALTKLGTRWHHSPPDTTAPPTMRGARPATWPKRGLVQIFFHGPWDAPEVPIAASYKASHWVAVEPLRAPSGAAAESMVFDVNTLDMGMNGGWAPRSWWEKHVLPDLIACFRRTTGGWWVRAGIEVAT